MSASGELGTAIGTSPCEGPLSSRSSGGLVMVDSCLNSWLLELVFLCGSCELGTAPPGVDQGRQRGSQRCDQEEPGMVREASHCCSQS